MAGYSTTPLYKKLEIKGGCKFCIKNAPPNYFELVAPMPDDVYVVKRLSKGLDIIHFFTKSRRELESVIGDLKSRINQNGMIWISWPKKLSKVPTDITEGVIREVILPLGLVDIKVAAIDEIWSGLKIVIRVENRI